AVAQQHAGAAVVRGHQVELAIAVDIAYRYRGRGAADGCVLFGRKRTVAIAQQYAYRAVVLRGHGEVELVVAVEVGQGRRGRSRQSSSADAVGLPLREVWERAADAQHHGHRVVKARHEVGPAVAVEVSND